MSKTRHHRDVPQFATLPRPVYARPEQWGEMGSQTDWHFHPWGQFSYAATGVLTVLTRSARYVAPPQYAIWVPARVPHQVLSLGPAKMRSLYIDEKALDRFRWLEPQVLEVTNLLRELIMQFCRQRADWPLHGPEHRIAQVLIDQLNELKAARMQLPLPEDRRLQALCERVQNNPSDQSTMEQLASQVGISARSVSRLFHQQTGMSFRQWRQRLRMLHALDCLGQKENVTEVALMCGYESVSAFVAAFREQFGVTPGRYFNHDL
ncbi:AraC family transcriptional regulator [Celerinatantimonas sp. MCCC 1A17872]|uniref:AraC family transcriptional regulator n=1 Tax=Celerinatantimonas sp. MCCC 1A17872 TaxID=3177514 RepID=UPI0038C0C7E5